MKKILITGASGLIGSELIRNFISNGNKVYMLTHSTERIENAEIISIDLSKEWDENSLPKQIDAIYHLAQSEYFRDFPNKAIDVFNVNTYATLKLLNYGIKAGCKKFIYASSGGIYGNSDKGFTEDTPINFNNDLGFYFSTKVSSEIIASNYSKFFDVVVTRFFFVYGQKQNRTMLIPRLVDNIKGGKPISLNGTEGIKINPIHVSDAAKALAAILDTSGSHVINIGGAEILSLKQICSIIGQKLKKDPIFHITDTEAKNLIGDISKMSKLLYTPSIVFASGVEELL